MFFSSQTEVYIYREPVDMRKGHDGLAGIVESEMNLELLSGSIFLFGKVHKISISELAQLMDGASLRIRERGKKHVHGESKRRLKNKP